MIRGYNMAVFISVPTSSPQLTTALGYASHSYWSTLKM